MATLNFRIEVPITKHGTQLPVDENRLVWLINDFFQDAGRMQNLSVGMSDVEFAEGAYFTNVSIKNKWYESAREMKKLARKYDPNYDQRTHPAFTPSYAIDLSTLRKGIVWRFQSRCDKLIVDRKAGIIENGMGSLHTELEKGISIRGVDEYRFLVFISREIEGQKKVGIVDRYGQTLITPKYDKLEILREGYYLAKDAGKFGVVTLSNKTVIPLKYSMLDIIPYEYGKENSDLLVAGKESVDGIRYGAINLEGDLKIPFVFESLKAQYFLDQRYAGSGLMVAQKDGKYGMIDKEGSVIIPFEYDQLDQRGYIGEYFGLEDGYLGAVMDNKFGIVDVNNNVVIPFEHPKDNLLGIAYPDIYFLRRPTNKTPEQRIADLADLEKGLLKQDWECYKVDYLRGSYMREHLDKLRVLYCNIDERDAGAANELWEKYARNGLSQIPDLFEDSYGLIRSRGYMTETTRLEQPSAENTIGIYLSPKERMQQIEQELRNMKLPENDRKIEALHVSLQKLRLNYQKYGACGSEQHDRGGLSRTLQVIEKNIQVKHTKIESIHNDNANILVK